MTYRVTGTCDHNVVIPRDRGELHAAHIAEIGRAVNKRIGGLEG